MGLFEKLPLSEGWSVRGPSGGGEVKSGCEERKLEDMCLSSRDQDESTCW